MFSAEREPARDRPSRRHPSGRPRASSKRERPFEQARIWALRLGGLALFAVAWQVWASRQHSLLLPDFVAKLEPYYEDFKASGGSAFGDYLAKRGGEVSQSLLEVTDARAANSQRAPLRKAYNTVRPSGVKNVETALPRLGALIQKYAG